MSPRLRPVGVWAALVAAAGGCVDFEEISIPRGPETTIVVVVDESPPAALVFGADSPVVVRNRAKILHISEFPCPPERYGLEEGWHALDGFDLRPERQWAGDTLELATEPSMLPIGAEYEELLVENATQEAYWGLKPPHHRACGRAPLVVTTSTAGFAGGGWVPLEQVDVQAGAWAPCTGAVVVWDFALRMQAESVQNSVELDWAYYLWPNMVLDIECAAEPKIALAYGGSDAANVETFALGPDAPVLVAGEVLWRPYPCAIAIDPADPTTSYVSFRRGLWGDDGCDDLFEFTEGSAALTDIGPGSATRLSEDEILIRRPNGARVRRADGEVVVCPGGPDIEDMIWRPGHYLYIDRDNRLGTTADLKTCTRFHDVWLPPRPEASADRRLLSIGRGVYIADSASGAPAFRIAGAVTNDLAPQRLPR